MTVTRPTHTPPARQGESIDDVRRVVLLARIGSTQPASVDHLLSLVDAAIANEVAR